MVVLVCVVVVVFVVVTVDIVVRPRNISLKFWQNRVSNSVNAVVVVDPET